MRAFPNLTDVAAGSPPPSEPPSPLLGHLEPARQGRNERASRLSTRSNNTTYEQQLSDLEAKRSRRAARHQSLSPIVEVDDSPYDLYSPFTVGSDTTSAAFATKTTPIGNWIEVGCIHDLRPLDGVIELEDVSSFLTRDQVLTLITNTEGSLPSYLHKALFAQLQTSLRADSEGAPSTHREAKGSG